MPGVEIKSMAGFWDRIDPTPEVYNKLIDSHGYNCTWEKAVFCPYRSPNNPLVHDATHTSCDNGMLYFDPTDIRVLVTGFSTRQQYQQAGRWESGTAMATTKPEHRISFLDKLTMLDSTMRFTELVRRSSTATADPLKYSAVSVDAVMGPGTVYVVDTDYELDSLGNISWISDNKPADDSWYTVSYSHHPVYIVADLLHDIRDTRVLQGKGFPQRDDVFKMLPVQAVIRLHFLQRDQSLDAPAPSAMP